MKRIYAYVLGMGVVLLLSTTASAQEPPVRIKGYGTHQDTNIVYHYRVTNISDDSGLFSFHLGWNNLGPEIDSLVDLTVPPIGWRHGRKYTHGVEVVLAPESTTQPPGWVVEVMGQEETPGYWLVWRKTDNNHPSILPGQTAEGFSVTLPQADKGFLNGHFSVTVRVSGRFSDYTGQIEKLDTTPPVLAVAATPTITWSPNNKPVPVTVTVSVKDDYDSQPEIKLESITANEALASGDIQGAAPGTDDRSFSLLATRSGASPAGRIYTLTYSATDGTGNKSTATTTVTVPHDQGKR